jgi:hypothetical protein
MYPANELRRLAAHKSVVQKRIGRQRTAVYAAVTELTRPLAWLDRVVAFWRRLPPIAKFAMVPLGFLGQRMVSARHRSIGRLLRWGPLAFAALRGFRSR